MHVVIHRASDDGNRIPDSIAPHACIKSPTDYELSLILKEIRYITDQVSHPSVCDARANKMRSV